MSRKLTTLKPRVQVAPGRLAVMKPNSWRNDKQTSGERGYTYKWQQARAAYLQRHPYCVYCLRNNGIMTTDNEQILIECDALGVRLPFANVVDHKVPHKGDMKLFWDSTNWQSLCTPCHSGTKQREEKHDQDR